ncbi:AGAP004464-PA-like protein [Anopheles sinensis]|uniref:AGAP004464-PA-like protein n=1 Tax=Anopheles sinensis TaxID=74873 RepID=A0A084VDD5_ANOSI|nr:AGAP004464-PA-like protein [Anopheles sinensis]
MCDSDSEEFASADEEFEEIEPDELEEVLGSVKPSDVSSKKSSAKETSAKSDVDVVHNSTENSNASEDTKTSPIKDDADENESTTEEKKGPPIGEKISKVVDQHEGARVKEDALVDKLDALTLTKAENDKVTTESVPVSKPTDAIQQPTVSPKDEAENQLDGATLVLQAKTTTNQTSEESVKPKKLILKPAKPQIFEVPKKPTPPTVKEAEPEPARKQAEPEATAEEGWDDFDDDWGDFNVDGGDGGKKVVAAKSQTDPGEEQRTSKASFKDVDIDDVEYKLKDFMKHKDDPPLTSVLDRLSTNDEKQSSSGGQSWGSWKPSWGGAAVSFLSTASKSVASITTNITQVIESGIGVPNPEDLARRQAEMEAKMKAEGYHREESEGAESTPSAKPSDDRFGFDQLVSGVTQISSKVITGGLDTLEGIGKKTMTILQENDPGLLNKRKLLGLQPNDGVILSQVLREAKAKTEERERNLKQIQKHQYKKRLHFETLFDDYHGLVHLEALEMLSKQAALKLESLMAPLTGKALEELQETMAEVKELCELPDMDHDDADGRHTADELEAKLKEAIVDLDPSVKVDFGEIVKSWTEYTAWIDGGDDDGQAEGRTAQDIFERAMRALAQTTALCVLRMHKLAEILLISEHHSTATEADVVVQLTTVFCWHLSGVATRFCSELTKLKESESADESDNGLVTNIFLEGSNSTSYIQNAFQLFIPILQMGAA